MLRRRLEDRIQDLVAKAVSEQDPVEVRTTMRQLRARLHEHALRTRKLATAKLTNKLKRATD